MKHKPHDIPKNKTSNGPTKPHPRPSARNLGRRNRTSPPPPINSPSPPQTTLPSPPHTPPTTLSILTCSQDFKGQSLTELLSTTLLTLTGIFSFLTGFTTQNIYTTLYVGLAGTALTFVVCVPPWPWYNQNPLPFLPGRSTGAGEGYGGYGITVDGKRVG